MPNATPNTASAGETTDNGRVTVPAALAHHERHDPTRIALSSGARELTYGDLAALTRQVAARLDGLGVRPGDRVALIGHNREEWAAAFLGVLFAGAVCVPVNTRLSGEELLRQLDVCSPSAVLVDDASTGLLNPILGQNQVFGLEFASAGLKSFWDLDPGNAPEDPRPSPDAPAVISFTSGTTGSPKGAVIEHGALARSAGTFAEYLDTSENDRTLVVVPLFHNTGFVDQLSHSMLVGAQVDLLSEFHVADAIDALRRRPATVLMAVPSIFRLLMLAPGADEAFSSCRVAVYGGAPMLSSWIEELASRWPSMKLVNAYGLTEFTSVSHMLLPPESHERPESVGLPVNGVQQRVVTEAGEDARPGHEGELWLAGPTRMAGYYANQAATDSALSGEWLRTGDLVTVDAEGFLTLRGREADVINRGGEKIHAGQVANALAQLPEIVDAAVVGAPHPIFGEQVVAFVVPRDPEGYDDVVLRQALAKRVADYAVPAQFVDCSEIPRNAAGKPDRTQLREAASDLVAGEIDAT